MISKVHPYLLIDDQSLIKMREQMKRGSSAHKLDQLLRKCRSYGEEQPHCSDNPGWYQYSPKFYDNVRTRTFSFLLAYMLTGETGYAYQAKSELLDLLENAVGMKYVLKGELDYTAGMAAGTAGLAYDWLYQYLNEDERIIIRKNIILRLLEVYQESIRKGPCPWYDSYLPGTAVINGGMGLALLALYGEWELAPRIYQQCLTAMKKNFFERIPADGGFVYGVNYWRIAMSQAFLFLESIEKATGHNSGLFDNVLLNNTGYFPLYFAPQGRSLGFGELSTCLLPKFDCTNWIFYYLSYKTNNPDFAWYRKRYLSEDPLELLWEQEYSTDYKPSLSRTRLYKSIGWGVMTGGTSEDTIAVSCKCGLNNKYRKHKDANSFVLNVCGQNIIYELGSAPFAVAADSKAEEDKKYFVSSGAHNTIAVGGAGQEEGKRGIIFLGEEDGCLRISGDASVLYGERVQKFLRNLILIEGRHLLLVDEVEVLENQSVQWFFHTLGTVKQENCYWQVQQKTVQLRMHIGQREQYTYQTEERLLPPTPECAFRRRDTRIIICKKISEKKEVLCTFLEILPYKTIPLQEVKIEVKEGRIILETVGREGVGKYVYDLSPRKLLDNPGPRKKQKKRN